MFGLQDFGIWFVYLLCILSAVACIVYGIINWNNNGDDEKQKEKVVKWQQEESELGDD